jgi:capsule biosynthesis phosphatase
MNYIFTCAGLGSRFLSEGIKPPKPLIRVHSEELLLKSLRSFTYSSSDNIYIVFQAKHRIREYLECKLKFLFPAPIFHWIDLDYLPNGQLLSACEAIKCFDKDSDFMIFNCDTSFVFDHQNFNILLDTHQNLYACIPVFSAEGDHWSFVETDPSEVNKATRVAEKVRISSNCSIGAYYFSSSLHFLGQVDAYTHYISSNKDLPKEFFVAPFIDYMINKHGADVYTLPALNPLLFGTPKELSSSFSCSFNQLLSENAWNGNQRKTLVVDVDGTLCGPPIKGDYSQCEPFFNVIDKLKEYDKQGVYIILATARNMRTFSGSLGLINKYTSPVLIEWLNKHSVPFDEILFGKPWGQGGVVYIDDKSVAISEFCNSSY